MHDLFVAAVPKRTAASDRTEPGFCCSKQPSLLLMAEAMTPEYSHADLSYERLETLGDAFLKYDCCIHVYHAYPHAHEGEPACTSTARAAPPIKCRSWKLAELKHSC